MPRQISPIALSVDAVLVAAKDLDSLCWIQAVGLAILLSFMSFASAQGMGLSAIWIAYGSHLIARLALCSWRINKVIPGLLPGQALMAKTH
jgi:Na+-driven multidrug efflux pump